MKKINNLIRYFYQHRFIRYLFVGGTTFLIDEAILIILHGQLNLNLTGSLVVAYFIAFVYNFSLNRWWAFSASENKTLRQHVIPYGVLFFFNLIFTTVFVSVASHHINYAVAKAFAVIIQMSWTYLAYKHLIFTSKQHAPASY